MDRTYPFVKSLKSPGVESSFSVESGFFSTRSHDTTIAVLAPMHDEPGYPYPLIVWLHGRGDDQRQLMRVMPHINMQNYVAVAPRGVVCTHQSGEQDRHCYGWQQSAEAVQRAEQSIFDGIETAVRKFHVNRQRIFIAGFNHGGTMAFRVAMSHPNRFAGVLSLCGPFPRGGALLGNLDKARRLPILLATGRDSRQYTADEVCNDLRLLHTAGLSIMLRQYPGGDELSPQMLMDMNRWIINQLTDDNV